MNRIRLGMFVHVHRAMSLLPRRDRRVLFLLMAFQASLSLADLAAIAALGLVTASAAALATGRAPTIPSPFSNLVADISSPTTIVALAVGAASLMITKSIVSFWGTRRAFRFLANRQALIAAKLANELLSRPLLQVMRRSTQENAYALTTGVFAVTVGILGTFVVIITELSLATILLLGLLVVDPELTFFTLIFFGTVAALLHFLLSGWAIKIGTQQAQAAALGHAAIQEAISGYREVVVAGRRGVYTARFQSLMWDVARVQSDRMMISSIGKYVFELALILGAGLLILSQAAVGDLASGAATVVIFFAAASRIMPALMRMQGAALDMKLAVGASEMSWSLIDDLNDSEPESALSAKELAEMYRLSGDGYSEFAGSVHIASVSLTYPGSDQAALQGVSIHVASGSSLALVGTSGAGKSTLADIILGVIHPDTGEVRISDLTPLDCVRSWPGALAYVPQDVGIVNGSVRANVAMGLPEDLVDDERVWEALERARLREFLMDSREGLDTLVGENGVKLSGGQRQRLGIARALYTRPRLLVLDEATSALDAQTEADISETILNMSGSVTRIIIAHRLATIRECDVVAYLDKGRLVASGTFDEVRQAIPDFDRQAELLGL